MVLRPITDHAYTPAERGSNERFNRNLRYFYLKGTRFEHISAQFNDDVTPN